MAAYLVMSPIVNDGILIKSGLILTALGFLGSAIAEREGSLIANQHCAIVAGALIICVGIVFRFMQNKYKRVTDWLEIKNNKPQYDRRNCGGVK